MACHCRNVIHRLSVAGCHAARTLTSRQPGDQAPRRRRDFVIAGLTMTSTAGSDRLHILQKCFILPDRPLP